MPIWFILFRCFRILGRPSQDEWPDDTVSIKWESFKVHERVELTNVIPNLCENAYDLIKVRWFVQSSCDAKDVSFFRKC